MSEGGGERDRGGCEERWQRSRSLVGPLFPQVWFELLVLVGAILDGHPRRHQ